MTDFDFRHPQYDPIFLERSARLKRIRANPSLLPALKLYYRDNPADFISDFGFTFEVRNPERGLPALIPFILFPKQREWIDEVVWCWKNQQPMVTEKSRDCGLSWLAIALGCTLCLFYEGVNIGYGSRKQEYIDLLGAPKALFVRARQFLDLLPPEFLGGWQRDKHAPHMRVLFPGTGSTMTGEAGDSIGRGDRASIYFTDEEAFLECPQLIEAALSQTTNCRISISTPNGMANPFAQKRFSGRFKVFTFHWTDDPRKDEAWYEKQKSELDPVTLAQEVDLDYSASVEGVLIPAAWVRSAVDAHTRLGVQITGARSASLDVADEGRDANALCGAHGILIEFVDEWSGKGSDIFGTVQRAFGLCDDNGYRRLRFDSDGLGAGVRGDARVINGLRADAGIPELDVEPFRGSEAVFDPEGWATKDRRNKDFFMNRKAQSWWALRKRFQLTHRAVTEGVDPQTGERTGPSVIDAHDELISIRGDMPNLSKLISELSQPTYTVSVVGKIVVDKTPEGAKSPNLADAVMIQFAPIERKTMVFTDADLAALSGR